MLIKLFHFLFPIVYVLKEVGRLGYSELYQCNRSAELKDFISNRTLIAVRLGFFLQIDRLAVSSQIRLYWFGVYSAARLSLHSSK